MTEFWGHISYPDPLVKLLMPDASTSLELMLQVNHSELVHSHRAFFEPHPTDQMHQLKPKVTRHAPSSKQKQPVQYITSEITTLF